MLAQPSFTKYYWAAWFIVLSIYLLSALHFPLSAGLGSFAVVVGIGSICVFNFEFGRLMGFLRVHCPAQYMELRSKPFVEALAFVHPSLIRRLWQSPHSPLLAHEGAFRLYRSAWLFSVFSYAVLIVLANTIQ